MKNYQLKTITQVRENFWSSFPEFQSEYRKTWRQNQYRTDIRCSFVDHVDYLQRDGLISESLAKRVTL